MEVIEKFNKAEFVKGMTEGVGIAVAFITFGFALGLFSKSYSLSNTVSSSMSFLVYSGASQTLLLKLFDTNFDIFSSIVAASMLNFRYVLINIPVYKLLDGYNNLTKALVGITCTDETVAFLSLRRNKSFSYALGLNMLGYAVFGISTILGVLLGRVVPDIIVASMRFVLYGTFLSLLVSSLMQNKKNWIITIVALTLKLIFIFVPGFRSVNSSIQIVAILVLTSLIYASISIRREKR